MKDYNNKIIKGSAVRGEYLRIARTRSIYYAALRHPYAKDVSCYINGKGDEVVLLTMYRLEVPDEPAFDIREEESIAIVCHPEDVNIPEVYALRRDFPVELPHSNARPYIRPVSLCVSDVAFADIRPQFNAFDFLNSIRRWFSLNSINQLHEADRQLEVFFAANEICCVLNMPEGTNPYVKYTSKSKFTSTLEFVEKGKATHYMVGLPTEKVYASNFARMPQTIGDLSSIRSTPQYSLVETLLICLTQTVACKATLPLSLLVYITQQDASGKKESFNLFLIRCFLSPRDIMAKQRFLTPQAFKGWFYAQAISVAVLMGMVTRQENALHNGVNDIFKKVAIIGTGTLGSAVTDHFVREGCSEEVVIADYDFLLPHNISRHTLTTDKVMTSKVRSIKEAYHGIFYQKVTAIEGNVFTLSANDKERLFKDTQMVVDLSTSIAVERHLSCDNQPYRRCTSFLNPKGDEIVLLMEDSERRHRLDLLEMDYYRNLIVDERFAHHLDQTGMVRTNNFSCRSESMILNYENIRVLSAILSRQIRKYYFLNQYCLNLWHIDAEDGTVSSQPMAVTDWNQINQQGLEVYLCKAVEEEINVQALGSPEKETGGCLFGSYDRDSNRIYVYYMVEAPEDSVHTPVSFVRGFKGLTQEYERITSLTYHQVRYLGEWHSHPNMSNTPSAADNKQFNELWVDQQSQDLPFVQMIHGKNGLYVRAAM